jgi:hypothetical protein
MGHGCVRHLEMVFVKALRHIRSATISPLLEETKELLAQTREQTRLLRSQHDFLLSMRWAISAQASGNPLNRFGEKFFSQSDEDGITLEIIKRLGHQEGIFLELGVGNGLENNTLVLLSIGWRGAWIGGENLAFDPNVNPRRLYYKKAWVSLDNINELVDQALSGIAVSDVDVLSVDLDGNDLYYTEALLKVLHPKLVIVEYNPKFPPPARWSVKYDPNFRWDGTDYHGASLSSFCDLLAQCDYTLVCCNSATGVNAFFVKNDYLVAFKDVPQDINSIFVARRFELPVRVGHPVSPRTITQMLGSPL